MMITLKQINQSELKNAINVGFSDDPRLLDTYHIISPSPLDVCVQHTYDNVVTAEGGEYYKVEKSGVEIGFVVILREPKLLLSFGINYNYRKKEILEEWLKAVNDLFSNEMYVVTLYPRNLRAIMFFIKNLFSYSITKDKIVVLWQ